MSAYARIPLGEVCDVNPRAKRTGRIVDDMAVSFVPMAAVDERLGAIAVHEERPLAEVSKGFTAFENGDILFAKITPCMENGKVALARNLTNGVGRGSTEFYVLRPGEKILAEYIYYFVRHPSFREAAKRNFTGTAGQQRVPKSFMENAIIPLPPLQKQRKIADLLNQATYIERQLFCAADRLSDFAPALFVKLFGNPIENPLGWETVRLGEVCTIIGGGTPRRNNEAYFGGDIPWATPTDVTALTDLFIEYTKETITETGLRDSSARLVPTGTVLLTSRATIGCTAIAAKPMATNQGFANLICGDRLIPEYLAHWLRGRNDLLIRLAGGTTFKEISKGTLKDIPIPLPALALQDKYAKIIKLSRRTAIRTNVASQTAAALTGSLMDRLLGDGTCSKFQVPIAGC